MPLFSLLPSKPRSVLLSCALLVWGFLFAAGRSTVWADAASDEKLNLAAAALVLPPGMSGPEKAAAEMLLDEIEKRSEVRLPTVERLPEPGQPAVVLGERTALASAFPSLAGSLKAEGSDKPEGYQIVSLRSGTVIVAGNDARGVLFGAGRLLRLLDYSREGLALAPDVHIVTAPRYPLRGHQLGYRPKTNAYDGWSVAIYEQYIRDLVIFGTNAIELLPPRTDDDADSPHFTLPPMRMMVELSRLCKKYGIECWVWYPALDKDYSNPATVDFALKEWGAVLRQLPRVDALFVPGGDPGQTSPKEFFPLLEKQAAQLRTFHPKAKVWMSPQGFNKQWRQEDFYKIIKTEPAWLDGVVYGPWQEDSLSELRAGVPARYPIRFYPDITHTFMSQYPVPDWDEAYRATENREVINPRPVDYAAIVRKVLPVANAGFITYSEGCNDDVNKFVWSSLGWDPDEDVADVLRDYSRYFIGASHSEEFAQGLLALERNWRGPLATNEGVYPTLARFQKLEQTATPAMLHNWRFEEALYRAYYDAADRARLLVETRQEARAVEALRKAPSIGSLAAVAKAEKALAAPGQPAASPLPPGTDWHAWRARVFELAEGLFQTIHMQLSVPRYQAEHVDRGANLDLIDAPLNDAPWMRERFAEVKALSGEPERLNRVREIVKWCTRGQVMNGPVEMVFHGLDKGAKYKIQIVYASIGNDRAENPMQVKLAANGKYEVHPMRNPRSWEPGGGPGSGLVIYSIPAGAVAEGDLKLTWTPSRRPEKGCGLQVAEVWLFRNAEPHPILTRVSLPQK